MAQPLLPVWALTDAEVELLAFHSHYVEGEEIEMSRKFALVAVEPEAIGATDLRELAASLTAQRRPFETYGIHAAGEAEVGWVLFSSDAGLAGVAWGADAQWTDAASAEEAVERFFSGTMVE